MHFLLGCGEPCQIHDRSFHLLLGLLRLPEFPFLLFVIDLLPLKFFTHDQIVFSGGGTKQKNENGHQIVHNHNNGPLFRPVV